jgi:hypothetical protein
MPATAEKMELYALGHPFVFKFVRHYLVDWLFLICFAIVLCCIAPLIFDDLRSLPAALKAFKESGSNPGKDM